LSKLAKRVCEARGFLWIKAAPNNARGAPRQAVDPKELSENLVAESLPEPLLIEKPDVVAHLRV
jgi:hypothetical protein